MLSPNLQILPVGIPPRLMKRALLYICMVFSAFGFQGNKAATTRWVITNGCSLKVNGSTNVNKFSCAITNYNRPDTIFVSQTPNQPLGLQGNIQLDVQQFDCGNPIMTADLRKTMKVKEYPKLMIFFININNYPEAGAQGIKGSVVIVLAGVSRRFEVDYRVVSADNGFINLEGSRKVNFTDFNLTPPRKLGGMIKTNNELSVVFDLRMKVLH